MTNDSSSWVILDHGERFSPTQHLAFPEEETSSESGVESSTRAIRPRSHSLNAGMEIFDELLTENPRVGLRPILGMHVPNGYTYSLEIQELNRRAGHRMLNLDNASLFFNRNDSDSLSSGSKDRHEDHELAQILGYPGHSRRSNSFGNFNSEGLTNQREGLELEPLYLRMFDINSMNIRKLSQEPSSDDSSDKGEEHDTDENDFCNTGSWLLRYYTEFVKFAHELILPWGMSHILALCLGFYLGRCTLRMGK